MLEWTIETGEGENAGKFRTHEGIVDMTITVSEWTTCEPKNLGKLNETTAEEQAAAESQSKWAKKKKLGYSEDISEAGDKSYIQCTLAHSYHDYKDEITFPAIGQTKENGCRCVITKDGAKSRKGESWVSVPHILEALKPVFDKFPEAVLDGELSNHDLREQLNMIMKLVRKTKNITPEVLAESKEKIRFYIYDRGEIARKPTPSRVG